MASPFFSSYWNQPSESRYSPSSIQLNRKPETASPKVISIPVHFVGSETNRISSSVRIQKVFRGFFVRKSVNRIVSIKNEVEEIERRIAKNETVELIRKDSKERLRINESLMGLLFKLDSVRGIDTGVRDLRKGVIRKAFALQERVDALPVESPAEENEAAGDSIKSDGVDDHPICDDEMPIENSPAAVSIDEMPIENAVDSIDQEIVEECNTMNSKTEIRKEDEEMDDWCTGVQQAKEEEETGEVTREDDEKMLSEEAGEKKSNEEELRTQMIRMMSEVLEKNEMQTRMINSLTHRVAQLEKAFLCDKIRRSNKKKKRHHDAAADGKQQ